MIGVVDRCVCHHLTFAELNARRMQAGWKTLDELCTATSAGTGCKSCRRYLQAMIDTGSDAFALALGNDPPQPCQNRPRP